MPYPVDYATSWLFFNQLQSSEHEWANRPDKTAEADLLSVTSPEPFLFLPAAGARSYDYDGMNVNFVSSGGFYRSSTVYEGDEGGAFTLLFSSDGVITYLPFSCAFGNSVRCVSE